MKNLIAIVTMIFSVALANAQNYEVLYMQDIHNGDEFWWCVGTTDGVIIHGNPACGATNQWNYGEGTVYCDSIVLICENQPQQTQCYEIVHGCGYGTVFHVCFLQTDIENPFPEPVIWKRQGESVTLTAGAVGWNYNWSNGSTENEIEVTEHGIYTVNISDGMCLDRTFPVEVRNNVEITLATCDLESNLNMVTWQTTPEQAEYVSQVEVKRDGLTVDTVPYTDSQFIDNIGSDAASRTYTVTAIATDGTPCPITSYPKETIHMAYLTGINNTIEVNWNAPTGYDLLGYNICEWNANDGTLTAIDYVGASVNSYTCQQSQFAQGYIVIQGVEASKDGETRLLSNRSLDLVGIEENGPSTGSGSLAIYPNPTNGQLKIEAEGIKHVSISNTLGQVIYEGKTEGDVFEYDFGKHEAGVYLVRIETARGVAVKKVTVTR